MADNTKAQQSDQLPRPKTQEELDEDEKFGAVPEQGEFVIYGKVYCKPEHADTLAALYSKMTKIAQTEPGVIYYKLARDSKDPTIFHFFEHYSDKASFVTHTERPESQQIFKEGYFKDVEAWIEKPIS